MYKPFTTYINTLTVNAYSWSLPDSISLLISSKWKLVVICIVRQAPRVNFCLVERSSLAEQNNHHCHSFERSAFSPRECFDNVLEIGAKRRELVLTNAWAIAHSVFFSIIQSFPLPGKWQHCRDGLKLYFDGHSGLSLPLTSVVKLWPLVILMGAYQRRPNAGRLMEGERRWFVGSLL